MVRAATRRNRCCNGCHSHSRNSCSDGRGGEAVTRVQVRVVLGASPAVEGLGRGSHTAAVAVEGSVQNSATFPTLLLKSSKKVVFLGEISSK